MRVKELVSKFMYGKIFFINADDFYHCKDFEEIRNKSFLSIVHNKNYDDMKVFKYTVMNDSLIVLID